MDIQEKQDVNVMKMEDFSSSERYTRKKVCLIHFETSLWRRPDMNLVCYFSGRKKERKENTFVCHYAIY